MNIFRDVNEMASALFMIKQKPYNEIKIYNGALIIYEKKR